MIDNDGRIGRDLAWLATWARTSPADEPKLASDSPPAPERRTGKPTPIDVDSAVVTLDVEAVRRDERARILAILSHDLSRDRQQLALRLATTTAVSIDGAVAALRAAPAEARPSPHSWFHDAMPKFSPMVGNLELGTDDVRTLYSR